METRQVIKDPRPQQTFTVLFKTLGMTFCAGQYRASTIDSGKYNATNLLQLRHVANLEGAEIRDAFNKTVAVLRIHLYPGEIEWITLRD